MGRGRYAVILCSASIYDHGSLQQQGLPTIARFPTRRAARAEIDRLNKEHTFEGKLGFWISQGYEGDGYSIPVKVIVRRWRRGIADRMDREFEREDARCLAEAEAEAEREIARGIRNGTLCKHAMPIDGSYGPCRGCEIGAPGWGAYRDPVHYVDDPGRNW